MGAELRAISSKTSSDRFSMSETPESDVVDNMEGKNNESKSNEVPPWKRVKKGKKDTRQQRELPPWKKGKKVENEDHLIPEPELSTNTDVPTTTPNTDTTDFSSITAFESSSASVSKMSTDGFKSDLPKTFKGDRGGTAEDADLLAELRAISSKTSSDRFS